jgi:hypothetical protein
MMVPFLLLLAALLPAIGMRDDVWTVGLVSGILSAALMILAVALPVTSLVRITRLLRPVLLVALAAPAIWMLLQVIPLPHALINPIWASTSAALNERLQGVISVDIGDTLLSLARYCAVIAIAVVTAAVALDRERAAHILYVLVAIAMLVAMRQIVTIFAGVSPDDPGRAGSLVAAVIGILLACAMTMHAIDQLQRSGRQQRSRTLGVARVSVAILSLFICAAATLVGGTPAFVVAALFGAGTLLAIFAIRRWLFGPWGVAGLAAAIAITLLGGLAVIPVKKDAQLVTALSTQRQAATERMLPDVALAGSGAGAFEALLPIYRDVGDAVTHEDPTAAAVIMIEMGPAFLWCSIIVALFGAWTLFNRSLSRGHDYIYAATGAGALIALPIMALVDGGILNFGASLMIGVLCGLAFAQSLSGAIRNVTRFELDGSTDEADKRKPRATTSPTLDRTWPRVALAIFGLLLAEQAAWIISAEWYSKGHFWPSTEQNAVSVKTRQNEIRKSASVAILRGDLWAESGFALVAQEGNPAAGVDRTDVPEPVFRAFTRALHYSPHRGDVWLMLAALASRLRPAGYDPAALLKMSYYTSPNDLDLLPLRLRVALGSDVSEPELRDLVKRDISLVLSRLPALKPALTAAYLSAPAGSRIIAENLISEVDPGYLKAMRSTHP